LEDAVVGVDEVWGLVEVLDQAVVVLIVLPRMADEDPVCEVRASRFLLIWLTYKVLSVVPLIDMYRAESGRIENELRTKSFENQRDDG